MKTYSSKPQLIFKGILVLILVLFLIFVYARANAKDVPLPDIEKDLLSNAQLKDEMDKCSDRDLMQNFGLDFTNYDSYIYYKSNEALAVEEILIIKAKAKNDLSAVQDAVETRISDQRALYDGYGADQVALLDDSVVLIKGNYLFYCCAPNIDKYEEVFRHAI